MSSPESNSNQWSALLLKAAEEIRSSPTADPRIPVSFHTELARSVERLAGLSPGDQLEGEIHGVARTIIDACPLTSNFAPSFRTVFEALQRLERNRRREQQHP